MIIPLCALCNGLSGPCEKQKAPDLCIGTP